MKDLLWCVCAVMALCTAACSSVSERIPDPPLYGLDSSAVLDSVHKSLSDTPRLMYADEFLDSITCYDRMLWIDTCGVSAQADTLLQWIGRAGDEAVDPEMFGYTRLRSCVDTLRARASVGSTYLIPDSEAVALESGLTLALVRYAYGQRYGYTRPHRIYNRLLRDGDAVDKVNPPYRELFDLPLDIPTDSLANTVIMHTIAGDLPDFLREIQPRSALHTVFADEYRRAVAEDDSARVRLALVNLERSRWRYERPDTGRYLLVNLAPQMLWAVDTRLDTCVEMRICCGNRGHKSPMLKSEVRYMEFNPYWVVPQTIIRNEVVAAHLHDSAYFARNNMTAILNSTGEHVDPVRLSASEWRSGRYTLRQEKGAGNSLGRIVFRFPNKFWVYLHDTNQPWAFQRDNRAVSHGCIRLQRPLDAALFMLGPDVDSLYIDRIRMSIDMPPLTAAGRRLKEKDPAPLTRHNLATPVPIWIDYYTLYPDIHGRLHEFTDNYGYDQVLYDNLRFTVYDLR